MCGSRRRLRVRLGFQWSVAQLKIVKTVLNFWARLNWEPARYQGGINPLPPLPSPQHPPHLLYLEASTCWPKALHDHRKEPLPNWGDRAASERGHYQEESQDRARASLLSACPKGHDGTSTLLGKLQGTVSRTQASSQRDWDLNLGPNIY